MSVNLKREGQWLEQEKRDVALKRAKELKSRVKDYLDKKQHIPNGLERQAEFARAKAKMLQYFNASEAEWHDWHWQMSNRIRDVRGLAQLIDLSAEDMKSIEQVGQYYRWAVSPYYLALVLISGLTGPIGRQAIPSRKELADNSGVEDPMGEEFTSPAPAITRRYPDRLIINVTNQCAMYCRHCQRRRNIGEIDVHKPRQVLQAALDYIKENEEIRDVLITGGDALLLSDKQIDWLLTELDNIPHVEIKRIGTRTPVTMPQRITSDLCAILEKHPPIYINTQFNHPLEVTAEAKSACDRLIKAGVVLGNQAVLLNNINNHPYVMKRLNQSLLQIRVRPYYIFHAKNVKGTGHFITSIEEGIAIMDQLRGYTSGLAVPSYIINAPNGYGKTPILPQYVMGRSEDNNIILRTWENRVIHYPIDSQH